MPTAFSYTLLADEQSAIVAAFGTSAPELFVNTVSSFRGDTEIVLGNILGSNSFNILVILGVASLVYPLSLSKATEKREIPLCVLASAVLGVLVRTFVGRFFERLIDRMFGALPVIKLVYNSLKQSFDLMYKRGEEQYFETVLVEYRRRGSWAFAFLTGKCTPQTSPSRDRTYYTVFLPSTPNPTTGLLLIVAEDEMVRTHLTKNETFKLIFSGGLIKDEQKTAKG